MHFLLSFIFVFFVSVVAVVGSLNCSNYELPCEDGTCVDSEVWCDSHADCSDGTDEKFCKKSSIFNSDPNKCPSNYFKCNNGPCIPKIGRCNGYKSCTDFSDEKNCVQPDSSSTSGYLSSYKSVTLQLESEATSTISSKSTTQNPRFKDEPHFTHFSKSLGAVQPSVDIVYSDFQHSDYSHQREKARSWLLSQRRSDFGWGKETPRALTALYISDVRSIKRNASDLLMEKQMEVQLSLDISRNETKAMKLTDVALYINALLASCKDPKNFYGENLVNTLRNSVNAAQREATFVNPSIYLTLCLNNVSTYDDTRKLRELFLSANSAIQRIDIQALVLMTITCIYRKTNYLTLSIYDGFRRQFLQRMNVGEFPGNVYESSLLFQALQELNVTMKGVLEYTLNQQHEDGSYGGILATYLALPVLAGKSFLQMNEHCSQRYTTDVVPIEILKNAKRIKMYIQFSLKYGYPPEVTETIQMQVAEGINFLDVMRLAQEVNPKFRFMIDGNREIPVVYSIGGIPNDAEKGIFWTLYLASSDRIKGDAGRLAPYFGDMRQLIPRANEHIVFWMRPL